LILGTTTVLLGDVMDVSLAGKAGRVEEENQSGLSEKL